MPQALIPERLVKEVPARKGLPPLVAIPLALTMRWEESPPTFCAMSETICDVANSHLYRRHAPPHWLEHLAHPLDDALPAE